ncbi:MAG TPA: diguanylate cyclase [Thermotogota bacterium]|nr:diguanylate cyclase [Thermotogota bacterium]
MTYEELSEKIKDLNTEVVTRKITIEALDELLKVAKQTDHISAQVHILAAMGQTYYYHAETKKAFNLLFDAFSLANQINDVEALTRTQYNLGGVYAALGLYEQAFQYFLMAMESARKNNLESFLGGIYNNIGVCLFKQDMVEEAGEYCRLAYDFYSDKKNLLNHVFTTLNMAVYMMRINDFKEAESYLQSVDPYIDELPPILVWARKMNYARLHACEGEFERSVAELNAIYKEFFSEKVETALYDQVLEWCYILKEGNKLYLAKEFLEELFNGQKDDQSTTVAELMLLLASLYESDGEYKKASQYFTEAVKINGNFYRQNRQFVSQNALKLIELTEKNQELANKSYRDAMTGCFNRFALQSEGKQIIDDSVKYREDIIVIMFDIDYFKQYNDYYGHLNGDNCIKTISSAVEKILPEEKKYIYRYGGDEFLILWPLKNHSGVEIAHIMLETIRNLRLPHENSPVSDITTISIGISTKKEYHTNLQTAIDAADMNLYKAKFNQRNCACIDDASFIK